YDEPGTPGYPLGPYLSNVPQNPFRVKRTIDVIEDNENFPSEPPDTFGWVYKPATMEIRLDWPGTDDNGLLYFDY
ncbi:MAG: hypothetical protein ACYTFM_11350, partial [Planctomycetota bacterium]